MFTLKVTKAEITYSQADNTNVLEVTALLTNTEDKSTQEKKLSFPIATTSDQLTEQLQAFLDTCQKDYDQSLADAATNAENEIANQTIESVVNLELTATA